ncbi:MAG: tetratricopeptide repeat protein [Chlorobiaceae bacterium]|nr:tetratricopeptide repeat protein [Chlorobiaceae bacterium]
MMTIEESKNLVQEGAGLHISGRFRDAEERYLRALELDGSSAVAHNNLAFLLMQERRFDEAEQHYRQAIELRPEYATAYTNLGQLCLLMERWQEAEVLLTRAVTLDTDEYHAHENLARLFLLQGRGEESVRHWHECLRLRPGVDHTLDLAHALIQQQRLDEALAELNRVMEMDDEIPRLYALLGIIHFARCDYGMAIRCFRQKLGLEPEDVETRHNLAMAFLRTGGNEEALTELRRILLLDPSHTEARNNLAVLELAAGQPVAALEQFSMTLEEEPANTKALYYSGVIRLQLGAIDEARKLLAQVVQAEENPYMQQASELLTSII